MSSNVYTLSPQSYPLIQTFMPSPTTTQWPAQMSVLGNCVGGTGIVQHGEVFISPSSNFKSQEHEMTYLKSKFSFLSIPRNLFSLCWITHSSKIAVTMYPRAVTWTFRPFIKSWTSTSLCANQVKSGMKKEQPKHRHIPLRNHEAGARYVRRDKDVKYKEDSLRNRTSATFQMNIAFPWEHLLAIRIWKLPQWIFFSE